MTKLIYFLDDFNLDKKNIRRPIENCMGYNEEIQYYNNVSAFEFLIY